MNDVDLLSLIRRPILWEARQKNALRDWRLNEVEVERYQEVVRGIDRRFDRVMARRRWRNCSWQLVFVMKDEL